MKWCLREFRFYELPAMESWFQKMAEKGWMIHTIYGGNFFVFKKIEPQKILFSAKVIGNMSLLSAENCEVAQDYREYCEAAGWKFLCSNRAIQVFCSYPEDELVLIETDERLEFEAVWKQVKKQILSESILAVLWTFLILYVPSLDSLLRRNNLMSRIVVLALCLFFFLDSLRGLIWYLKGKKALREFRKVPYYGETGFGTLMLFTEGMILAGFLLYLLQMVKSSGFRDALYLLLYFVIYLMFLFGLQRLIRKRGFRKGTYILTAIIGAVVLTLVMTGINVWIQNSSIPDELFAEKEEPERFLTEEDLGLSSAEKANIYGISDKSILGEIQKYGIYTDEIVFSYTYYETRYDFLRKMLRKELLTPYKTNYSDIRREYVTEPCEFSGDVMIYAVYDRYILKETGEVFEENLQGYLLEKEERLLYLSFTAYVGSLEQVTQKILNQAVKKM